MKKILIIVSAIHACIISMLLGQNFTFHSNSPFGIEIVKEDTTRSVQTITFFDYDGDGDQDILLTGLDYIEDFNHWSEIHFFMEVQENIGTPKSPFFGERFELFEEFPYPIGYFFASPGDLNNDDRVDFIVAADIDEIGNSTLQMFTNTGMQGPNQFDVSSLDAMGLPDFVPESFFRPELVDLDQDGDLDLMNSGFDPPFAVEEGPNIAQFSYARNVGTKSAPEFQGWYHAPYDLVPDTIGEILTSGDIDNDGDVDFIGSMIAIPADSMNYLLVHLNTPGADSKPAFTIPLKSPFGLPSTFGEIQFAFPELVDIDDDGDLDLFVFQRNSDILVLQYYENNLCTGETNEMSVNLCEGESITIGGNIYTEGGEYTISFEGSDGCDSTILLTIELLPIYTVSLNENICEGESFVIGNETFTDPGDYTVFVVAENGCDSIVLLSLFVHNVDNSVTLQQNTLTANDPFATYQWINCDSGENIPGATNQSYVVLTTGNYAVSLTDGFGCSAVSECVSVIISGIEEDHLSSGITLYPNPSDSWIYILNETQYPVSTLTLINISGQVVEEIILNSKNSVDVSSLEKGVYFVKIKIKGLEIIKKLIVI